MKWRKLMNGGGRSIITTDMISDDSDGPTDCQEPTLTKKGRQGTQTDG
jgi:hypothetical protein